MIIYKIFKDILNCMLKYLLFITNKSKSFFKILLFILIAFSSISSILLYSLYENTLENDDNNNYEKISFLNKNKERNLCVIDEYNKELLCNKFYLDNEDLTPYNHYIIQTKMFQNFKYLNDVKDIINDGDMSTCILFNSGIVGCLGDVEQSGNEKILSNFKYDYNNENFSFVDNLENVKKIVSLYDAYCALLNDGNVKCWGKNAYKYFKEKNIYNYSGLKNEDLLPFDVKLLNGNITDIISYKYGICEKNDLDEICSLLVKENNKFVYKNVNISQIKQVIQIPNMGYCFIKNDDIYCYTYEKMIEQQDNLNNINLNPLLNLEQENIKLNFDKYPEKIVSMTGTENFFCILDNKTAVRCAKFNYATKEFDIFKENKQFTNAKYIETDNVSSVLCLIDNENNILCNDGEKIVKINSIFKRMTLRLFEILSKIILY